MSSVTLAPQKISLSAHASVSTIEVATGGTGATNVDVSSSVAIPKWIVPNFVPPPPGSTGLPVVGVSDPGAYIPEAPADNPDDLVPPPPPPVEEVGPLPSTTVTELPAVYIAPDRPVHGGALLEVVERIDSTGDQPTNYINLLSADQYSMAFPNPPIEPSVLPLAIPAEGVTGYSYERWVRFRFTPPFTGVQLFRFFCPNYAPAEGWTILWGTTSTFQTPVNTASAIAVNPLPLADPLTSNCGGASILSGTGVQYSDWVVLQAQVDSSVSPGPIQGFLGLGVPLLLDYEFRWLEL